MTRNPTDVVLVATALWLLATEILDILMPDEVTGAMIAAAMAPPVFIGVAVYTVNFYRRNSWRA